MPFVLRNLLAKWLLPDDRVIASIRGEVLAAGIGWVVLDVSGVGFRVEVPSSLSVPQNGAECTLHTSLIVREDSLTLFGFRTPDELEVFGHLLAVSGVGPRSALGVLGHMGPAEIAHAVQSEDERPFRKVSGIGPKTAKLIAVQLAGKVTPERFGSSGEDPESAAAVAAPARSTAVTDVEQGLIGLGYSAAQAERAVSDALDAGAPSDSSALLRAALALLQAPRRVGRDSS